MAAGFAGLVPEGPEAGGLDLEAAALAVDADAAVVADRLLLLGCCEGLLTAGPLLGLGGLAGGLLLAPDKKASHCLEHIGQDCKEHRSEAYLLALKRLRLAS